MLRRTIGDWSRLLQWSFCKKSQPQRADGTGRGVPRQTSVQRLLPERAGILCGGNRSRVARGLVHFSARRRIFRINRGPKTWTCPLPAAQGGQSHFRGGQADSRRHVPRRRRKSGQSPVNGYAGVRRTCGPNLWAVFGVSADCRKPSKTRAFRGSWLPSGRKGLAGATDG